MKRLVIIFLLIVSLMLISCTVPPPNDNDTETPTESLSADAYPTAVGTPTLPNKVTDTFIDDFENDADIRALFELVASESICVIENGRYTSYLYGYYKDGTNAFFGASSDEGDVIPGDQFELSESVGNAISSLEDMFPELLVWIRDIGEGRMGVLFSGRYRSDIDIGCLDQWDLIFTRHDLSDYGYIDLSGGWYVRINMLPLPTTPATRNPNG